MVDLIFSFISKRFYSFCASVGKAANADSVSAIDVLVA
jgi:hypothetical protein